MESLSQARTCSVKQPRGAPASMVFAIVKVLSKAKNYGEMAEAERKKTVRGNGFLCCLTEASPSAYFLSASLVGAMSISQTPEEQASSLEP
jgi:hypothetical protein